MAWGCCSCGNAILQFLAILEIGWGMSTFRVSLALLLIMQCAVRGQSPGTLVWEFITSGRISTAPALSTNGIVYFGSNNRVFYALDATTGAKLWHYETDSGIQSSAAIGFDGALYFGSDDFKVYALNPDGTKRWDFTTGGRVMSSPAIGIDGTIYIGSDDFNLYALRADGSEKWRLPTGGKVSHGVALGVDGTIYFGSADGYLRAVSEDGSMKWQTNLCISCGQSSPLSPAIGPDRTIYVGREGSGLLFAINPNGSEQWRRGFGPARGSPTVGPDGLIHIVGQSEFYAMEPDGFLRWFYSHGRSLASSPCIGADGTFYFNDNDSRLLAIGSNGALRWTYGSPSDRGYEQTSAPVISSTGVVYVGLGNKLVAVMGTGGGLAESPWPMFQKNPFHNARNQVIASNTAPAALALNLLPSLTITGSVGRSYRIEFREELGEPESWQTLTDLVLPASPWRFQDTTASGRRRFYRAVAE